MKKRLRILLTISDLIGAGAERELSNLLSFLPRDRFEPHLCLWRDVLEYPVPDDVPVYILRKYRPWDVVPAARRLIRLLDDLRPDLVFSQLPYVSLVTGIAVRWAQVPPRWIARLAGNPFVDIRFPLLPLARKVFPNADHVVGCSRGVTAALVSHLRVDPERASTLYNVIDVPRIRALAQEDAAVRRRPGTFTVVHAGRFTKQKNQQLLLKAFSKFRGRNAELWMLGKGLLADRLQHLAKDLKIEDQVRWLGFQSNPFALFREADCLALSSDHEGLPNVIVESLVAGTPVVSTDCPFGPRELLKDGKNGLLVSVGNREKFAAALERMAAGETRLEFRRNIPADVGARFAADQIVPDYCALFERVGGT